MKRALYLSGGGARGAYQVGVLKAMQEIMGFKSKIPFDILSCVSAGSINGIMLANYSDNFGKAVVALEDLWSQLDCSKVFYASNWSIIKAIARVLFRFLFSYSPQGYLLDTKPLGRLLEKHINFAKVNQLILQNHLPVFEVVANCYDLAESVSFINSKDPYLSWRRVRHISYRTDIEVEHILASSAIPLFFPAIKIGSLHYGDGTIRLVSPLRGTIKSGAEKVFIIGTRQKGRAKDLSQTKTDDVSFARVLGSMLNALFLDNLDRDLELINGLNERMIQGKIDSNHIRCVDTLHLSPSCDLASFTGDCYKNVPVMLRLLMRSFGSEDQSADFLSFLLFEREYTQHLIETGYQDGLASADQIIDFFKD